jgi:hypothetical protein
MTARILSLDLEDDRQNISSQQHAILSKAGGPRFAMARDIDQIQEKRSTPGHLLKSTDLSAPAHPGFQLTSQKSREKMPNFGGMTMIWSVHTPRLRATDEGNRSAQGATNIIPPAQKTLAEMMANFKPPFGEQEEQTDKQQGGESLQSTTQDNSEEQR